uniref:G-protein coupled receptors family 1 profile domain-containing protein n=1 Tax=Sphenodon punctatus TaxID=8508 RepID=A0A8D0H242_SPHPU
MKNASGICSPSMPFEESKILLVAVYSTVFALGLPANCLTVFLTWVQIRKKNVLAVYLFSLSFCELLYLSTLPLWIIYVQNNHKWEMGSLACRITGYIFFCNIYISILLLCCISLDRYMAMTYALECRGIRQQKTAMFVTLALFVVVLAIHAPVFSIEDGTETQNHTTCFETLPLTHNLAYFSFARFLVGLVAPFTILIFTNYKIFRRAKTSCGLNVHQKAKVKYLAIAIITIFLVCFAPYNIVLLIRAIHFTLHPKDSCPFERSIYTTYVVFFCLSTVNSIADPIIYVLASENVRKEMWRWLREWRSQSSFNLFPVPEGLHPAHLTPSCTPSRAGGASV